MKWFVKCLQDYVNFTGRARRAEFWYFILFYIIVMAVAMIVDKIIGSKIGILQNLCSLGLLLPYLAVAVRRLHDTNRSGKMLLWCILVYIVWIVLIVATGLTTFVAMMSGDMSGVSGGFLALLIGGGLIFFVWGILFLVWFCTNGTVGENKYGPDPKAVAE